MLKPKPFSPLIILTSSLITIGLIFISLSTLTEASSLSSDPYFFLKKQALWLIVGIVCFLISSRLNLDLLNRLAIPVYYFSLVLLIIVLLPSLGIKVFGARRWLNLGGLFGLQPSEFFKLVSIIFFPYLFSTESNRNLKKLLLYLGIPFILIILEPNLSTAILIAALIISIYYLSGGEIIPLFVLCLLLIFISLGLIATSPYRLSRLQALISPENSSPSYHQHQVSLALASGGIFGKGFANSDQKYKFVPKISTDSILAIIGEELGFIGILVILFLFLSLINHLAKISQRIPNHFHSLVVSAVASWIALQTLINISAIVALIPLTGIPLPFISYGGSSLVTLLSAIGLVYNIEKHHYFLLYSKHEAPPNCYHRHPPHSSHRTNSST